MNSLEVRTEKLAPMRVARFHALGRSPEAEAWSKLRSWAEPLGLLEDAAAHPVFGFNNPSPSPSREEYGYEFWIRLGPETPDGGAVAAFEFPGGWYAVMTHRGFPNPGAWMQLLGWVRNSCHRHRQDHELEHPRNALALEPEVVFDLYLPIDEPVAATGTTNV